MTATIILFHGEQDGYEFEANDAPDVVWVPNIQEDKRLRALQQAGQVLTEDDQLDSASLPYVRTAHFVTPEGKHVYHYSFDEELLIHEQESSQ